jgi:multidrug efflux pump subunit AcrA (membrane-fusion protein)
VVTEHDHMAERADLEAKQADLEDRRVSLAQWADLEARRASLEAQWADLEAKRADLEAKRADLEAKRADFETRRTIALIRLVVLEHVNEVEEQERWYGGVSCTHIVVEELKNLGDRLIEEFEALDQRGVERGD